MKTFLLSIFSALFIVACSDVTTNSPVFPQESLMNVTVLEPAMDAGIFYEGSIDEPMAVERPSTDVKRVPFGDLLRALKLSSKQEEIIKGLLAAHEDCMKQAINNLRQTEKDILAPYNKQRSVVHEKVKSGEISREEAKKALVEINNAAREALRANSDARKVAIEASQKCREQFIAALKGILTPEQLPIIERWVANQKKSNGKTDTKDGGRRP